MNSKNSNLTADEIQKLVNERIEAAEKNGIRKLVDELYSTIQYFPSWIKHSREYVPEIVQQATEESSKNAAGKLEKKKIFKIDNNDFIFCFYETTSHEHSHYGQLDVNWNGRSVFSLGMSIDFSRGNGYTSPEWHSFNIEGYIPGDWESILRNLKDEILRTDQEREKRKKEDPKKLDDLKKKFGL